MTTMHGKSLGLTFVNTQPCGQTVVPLSVHSASITAPKGGGSIALAKQIPPNCSNLMLKAISQNGVQNLSGVIWVWSLEWEENKKHAFFWACPLITIMGHSISVKYHPLTPPRKYCFLANPSTLTVLFYEYLSSILLNSHLRENVKWKRTEGTALTSPAPSLVSSMSWPCKEPAWLKPPACSMLVSSPKHVPFHLSPTWLRKDFHSWENNLRSDGLILALPYLFFSQLHTNSTCMFLLWSLRVSIFLLHAFQNCFSGSKKIC